jgi:methylphosphotriester-DNA--protein-cysteine methyltransferase
MKKTPNQTKTYKLRDRQNKAFDSATKGRFGGHKGTKVYGRLNCPGALRWIAKGHYVKHRVFFQDEATAKAAGYRPCSNCMRAAYKTWKAEKCERLPPVLC